MSGSRRDFIKISSLSAAGILFGSHYVRSAMQIKKMDGVGSLNRTPTFCEVCFWQCAGWVYKNEEGKIKKVIGRSEERRVGKQCR